MIKQQFSTEEALLAFFDQLKKEDYLNDLSLYRILHGYRLRHRQGALNDMIAKKILTDHGGFRHVEYYLKN